MTRTIEMPGVTLPEIDDATRREFLIGAAGLLLFPAACGSQQDEGSEALGETRSFEHALGTTQVPAEPRRVVSLTGSSDMDALLALGFEPVAAGANYPDESGGYRFGYWLDPAETAGIEPVTIRPEPNIEQIAALEPDLIVGHSSGLESIYDRLSEFAPTVAHEYTGRWDRAIRLYGRLLNRPERAESVVSEIQATVDEAAARLPEDRPRVAAFGATGPDGIYVYLPEIEGGPGRVLSDLGLLPPQAALDAGAEIGLEGLSVLQEADVLFGLGYTVDGSDPLDEVESEEVFRRLPAVSGGRYERIPVETSFAWAFETAETVPLISTGVTERVLNLLGQEG